MVCGLLNLLSQCFGRDEDCAGQRVCALPSWAVLFYF